MDEQTNLVPEWMEGKKINESLFCREYLLRHPMIAIAGTFFTVDGRVTDEAKPVSYTHLTLPTMAVV